MRYIEGLADFKTKHWIQLWRSSIDSLAALKNISQSVLVAMDIERHPHGRVSEIGIAELPPHKQILGEVTNRPFGKIEAFFHQNSVQSYSFRIQGRQRKEDHREPFHFGQVQSIKPEEIESVLANLFMSLKDQFQNLILDGFDLNTEFKFMASNLCSITQYISWVDLQSLVGIPNTPSPSMRETLAALGIAVGRRYKQRSAGSDAVYELVIERAGCNDTSAPLEQAR